MKKEESYGSPEAALVNEILNYCKKLMHLAPSEKNAKLSAISSLIDRGADVNSTFEFNLVRRTSTDNVLDFLYFTGHRGTLLQFAANNGSVELVKLLLNRGADVTLRNVAGYTALRYAVENGDIDIVKALLEFGGDVNERDEDGKSLLHDAVRCGQINIVRLLLDHDAELEQVDRFGNTPAMEAFDWQRDDIFKLLIERGAGKVEGYSAFEKAIICDEFQEVSKMLD